ncbi:Asp-tRNA(Asn)/Glu-tRNA(Gln) amidotransferase subunit GatB [Candidatus Uabimicrobium amorphum]|uniref:Aspartyl/glutamyl-tRNA(Asn/Gln) amidotransferase subunit B n=1 Tax=Uabimicrobium amorphum TaxID=2596890 RepID=A0A5S9F213_UABAM|nr:Asp-tRNA(Asn)/Glu-tRNA(Gln) amidotransferase subunit GatB [Candidatus Uabimicrobium amorphum]BBM81904.1 aspartyl/glutamyl-tRNA(Asn/Gln) amidotransferase subunit B [Candidatus Uabimicrobium amorphum]
MEKQINSLIRLSGVEIEKEQREILQEELQTFLHYAQIIDKAPDFEDDKLSTSESFMVDDVAVDWQGNLLENAPVLKESSYLVPPQQSKKHHEAKLEQSKTSTLENWEVVIGLEVHAQLLTKSKLFCRCSTEFGKTPNANTCPVCTGQPGALPVLNKEAIRMAILAGLAMNCEINNHSVFARKNYFYPDSPKSYQISQFEKPLCSKGHIVIENEEAQQQQVRLNRIHVEEDAGKMIHVGTPGIWGAQASAVDFNRTSIPLIEIVSEPDIQTPYQAKEYMTMLRTILVSMNICDGNMEEGSLRCDANVSLRKKGESELGVKTEIKNLNSFKAVERALEYEIKRQKEILDSGNVVEQQTRLWDDNKQKTLIMRTKEDSHDYRYFPDPDLRPVEVPAEWVTNLRSELPQMPLERKEQYLGYGLSQKEAIYLMHNPHYAAYFEDIRAIHPNAKAISNWFFSEILSYVNARSSQIHITPQDFADFLQAIDNEEISGKIGKQVVKEAFMSNKGLMQVIEEKQLRQISDEGAIAKIVEEVLQKNEQQVAAYRGGKTTIFGYFVGQTMKASHGKANPGMVNKILREKLDG